MFKLFARKTQSGRVELDSITPKIAVEDKDQLFTKALKETAQRDLAKQIKYFLDCIAYGKDVIDDTNNADVYYNNPSSDRKKIQDLYPKAVKNGFGYSIGNAHSQLAKVLATEWVEENYNQV